MTEGVRWRTTIPSPGPYTDPLPHVQEGARARDTERALAVEVNGARRLDKERAFANFDPYTWTIYQ